VVRSPQRPRTRPDRLVWSLVLEKPSKTGPDGTTGTLQQFIVLFSKNLTASRSIYQGLGRLGLLPRSWVQAWEAHTDMAWQIFVGLITNTDWDMRYLGGHTRRISSVAFSSDGSQIISGSDDCTVRMWDAVSGKHKHTLKGHTDWVCSVAFSPDGSQIISGSADNTVRVWDAVSGKHQHTLKGHTGGVHSVAFSPDGSQIISGADDFTVRLWDAVSGKHKHTLKGHTYSVCSVTFSPDGSQIISGSWDSTVRVWDAVSGKHKHTLKGHTDYIRSVAFSPDGSQIISGSDDRTVRVWDAGSGSLQHVMNDFNPSEETVYLFLARSPSNTEGSLTLILCKAHR
jgi:WD40 repeat protein